MNKQILIQTYKFNRHYHYRNICNENLVVKWNILDWNTNYNEMLHHRNINLVAEFCVLSCDSYILLLKKFVSDSHYVFRMAGIPHLGNADGQEDGGRLHLGEGKDRGYYYQCTAVWRTQRRLEILEIFILFVISHFSHFASVKF